MFLGNFYGKETISTELKEFCLKICPTLLFSKKEITEILKKGFWNPKLTKFIIMNLKLYIKFYLPKYIVGFIKAGIKGKLVIGVNDIGVITGIPSKIKLTKKLINDMIINNIGEYVNELSIFDCIDIDVQQLQINRLLVEKEDFRQIFSNYNKKVKKYKKQVKKYKKKKSKWLFEIDLYRSLHNVMNLPIPRENFRCFLLKKKLYSMVEKLDHNKIIPIPHYTILQLCKLNDKNIFYWLMKFKDIINAYICTKRPKKPMTNPKINLNAYISQITKLNSHFIDNPEINNYIITINIDGTKKNKIDNLMYKNYKTGEWKSPERLVINGEPCCQ